MGQPGYMPCELPWEAVERIPWLRRRLLCWFKQSGRSFPWRDQGRTPYEVVVAEILLQRTTATGVARTYAGFIVYGRAEPLLDVNMARCLWRFFGSLEPTTEGPKRALHALALRLVSGKRSLQVNWAVLDFGALVCQARRPRCQECPLRTRCQYAGSQRPTPTSKVLSGSRSAGGR